MIKAVPSRTICRRPFDGPPTLERSGPEHRVGRFPSSSLTGEDRDERWSLP